MRMLEKGGGGGRGVIPHLITKFMRNIVVLRLDLNTPCSFIG